jgi:hypothetical protein
MLATAKEAGDLLATLGLGATLLADSEKVVAELEELNAAVLEAKRSHVGASAELGKVASELVELIGVRPRADDARQAGLAPAMTLIGPPR